MKVIVRFLSKAPTMTLYERTVVWLLESVCNLSFEENAVQLALTLFAKIAPSLPEEEDEYRRYASTCYLLGVKLEFDDYTDGEWAPWKICSFAGTTVGEVEKKILFMLNFNLLHRTAYAHALTKDERTDALSELILFSYFLRPIDVDQRHLGEAARYLSSYIRDDDAPPPIAPLVLLLTKAIEHSLAHPFFLERWRSVKL